MAENNVCDKKRLRTFVRNVRQEILNLQAGESRFRTSAIHFPQTVGGGPPGVVFRLDQLDEHPSQKNLDIFLQLASQDLSAKAGVAFKDWSTGIFPEDPDVAAKAKVKPFELQIKDGFYDLFKAAQIPLNPKQVDLIMTHSGKLAKAFQGEIHKTIKEQLEELVTKLKAQEVEDQTVVVKTGEGEASYS